MTARPLPPIVRVPVFAKALEPILVIVPPPLKVTFEVDAVNAVTPDQLPPILITDAPEQVRVPTVILPVEPRVPVDIVMVPLLDTDAALMV